MSRKLKVEQLGDGWRIQRHGPAESKPGIRLKGYWLAAAGFTPGSHAHVVSVAPGVLQITQERPMEPPSPDLLRIKRDMCAALDRANVLLPQLV